MQWPGSRMHHDALFFSPFFFLKKHRKTCFCPFVTYSLAHCSSSIVLSTANTMNRLTWCSVKLTVEPRKMSERWLWYEDKKEGVRKWLVAV
jgi:hypothetical protein